MRAKLVLSLLLLASLQCFIKAGRHRMFDMGSHDYASDDYWEHPPRFRPPRGHGRGHRRGKIHHGHRGWNRKHAGKTGNMDYYDDEKRCTCEKSKNNIDSNFPIPQQVGPSGLLPAPGPSNRNFISGRAQNRVYPDYPDDGWLPNPVLPLGGTPVNINLGMPEKPKTKKPKPKAGNSRRTKISSKRSNNGRNPKTGGRQEGKQMKKGKRGSSATKSTNPKPSGRSRNNNGKGNYQISGQQRGFTGGQRPPITGGIPQVASLLPTSLGIPRGLGIQPGPNPSQAFTAGGRSNRGNQFRGQPLPRPSQMFPGGGSSNRGSQFRGGMPNGLQKTTFSGGMTRSGGPAPGNSRGQARGPQGPRGGGGGGGRRGGKKSVRRTSDQTNTRKRVTKKNKKSKKKIQSKKTKKPNTNTRGSRRTSTSRKHNSSKN